LAPTKGKQRLLGLRIRSWHKGVPKGTVFLAGFIALFRAMMMGYPGPKYKNPKRLGEATQSLYINVDDVDAHFQGARKEGTAILEEPKDTSYGPRRYGAEDPEGHQWYFAEDIHKRSKPRRQRRNPS
jgi:uncharacterized glyoxalase superfamily protein PhnB